MGSYLGSSPKGIEQLMDMMSDEVVASPCRNVCRLDDENVCEGCRRTIDEIARWIQMSNAEKRAVLARIEEVIE